MKTVLFAYVSQITVTVGSVFAAGILIHYCKLLFARACGRHAAAIVNGTGIIGTPVHELSHALMCLVFGHRITEIQLFNFRGTGNALGYVKHTFNRKNLYQRIGNFFIGIAPIVNGSAVLLLLMRLLMPELYRPIAALLREAFSADFAANGFLPGLKDTAAALLGLLLSSVHGKDWHFWAFLLPAVTVAVHMELSREDIRGSRDGFVFFAGLLLLVNSLLYLLRPEWLAVFTGWIMRIGFLLTSILFLSVLFSSVIGILSAVIIGIRKIIGRRA